MARISKNGGRMPKKKGLAAMLDGMLAYVVAFTSLGFLALLMMNTQEADMKSTYTLNAWAEDIADSVAMSIGVVESLPDASQRTAAEVSIQSSLQEIAKTRDLRIEVSGGADYDAQGTSTSWTETATAKRLVKTSGGVAVLTVKVSNP